ncbi:MAG TPA: ABC transporter permease [Anaerolineales bacterium]|nr:ABC transporter permease [Anaerolineales bacterium]
MRAIIVFRKTLREMSRDAWMLGLTLAFTPFFVILYWIWFSGGSTTYNVILINQDVGIESASGTTFNAGDESIVAIVDEVTYADGKPLLNVIQVRDRSEADSILKDRGAAAFILIPEDFSQTLEKLKSGDRSVTTNITFGGDVSNPYYMVAVNLALTGLDRYVQEATGQQPLIGYVEEPLGLSAARSEFETYVPGTLVFSVVLLIFLASMIVAREIEMGALRRLQLTPMTSIDLLGGITLALALIGALSIALAFGVAVLLGFRSLGPLWVAILVGTIASLSVIGMGMVVASFTRTVSQAFVVANFPLALMMFFSGVIFPMPKVTMFTLAGHEFGIYDILPPTHAVVALNKVLTLGAGLDEVVYELSMLTILSILYFAIGAWLFKRYHLRSG